MLTTEIENFPGQAEGMTGPDLMKVMKEQAVRFGAEVRSGWVTELDFSSDGGPHRVKVGDEWHEAAAVIISTGASPRLLDLPGMEPATEGGLMGGGGVSTCATCDGFFFKGKELAIVGAGDSAMEEANFLTRFATKVTVIHRREGLRASKIMADRARNNPKIDWALNKVVSKLHQENNRLSGIELTDTQNGETSTMDVGGLFIAIGHDPNTEFLKGKIDLDDEGYILHQEHTMTNVAGVFAAGDCVDHRYRQAITAAGQGCQAAIDAERWLEEQGQ
ncbi:MAG: NAD(P)/FAD-dependent oxidoreductase [Planctomycetota bacterium]|jgi:thioredoxin reductase (NADPH)